MDTNVDELLARFPPAFQPEGRLEWLGNAGGLSGARLWRYQSSIGRMCLRAWPSDGPGRPHLEQVHQWLLEARGLSFIPVPFRGNRGDTLLEAGGTFWELSPWMPGDADLSTPPSSARVRAAFGALAAFHRSLTNHRRQAVSPGLVRRLELVIQLERGQLDTLEAAIANHPDDLPECRYLAPRWLALARVLIPRLVEPLSVAARQVLPLQPCLRDARRDHFLFVDDRLTGLVDFGSMGIDCVAGDLSRLMADWLPNDGSLRHDALAAYSAVRPLDPRELDMLEPFESSADLLIAERWIHWHYLEQRRFSDPTAVVEGMRRGVARLERRCVGIVDFFRPLITESGSASPTNR